MLVAIDISSLRPVLWRAAHLAASLTAAYKRETVRQADACKQSGEIGALLRRETLPLDT